MKTMLKVFCACLFGAGLVAPVYAASTLGTASFTVTLSNPPGGYNAHVDAYWVTDSTGRWIQTVRRDAGTRGNYLYQYIAARAGNTTVDGFSGATISTWTQYTVTWDCLDVNNNPLPDGEYRFYVEMTDYNGQGYWTTNGLPFIKGTNSVSTNYPNMYGSYITGMRVDYTPAIHDIAVTSISPISAQTNPVINMTVGLTNKGGYAETFTLSLSNVTSGTNIGSAQVTNMAASTGRSVVIPWGGMVTGAYVLQASVDPVIEETNIANNILTSTVTLVPTPHDLAVLSLAPAIGFTNLNTTLRVLITNETTTTENFWLVVSNLTSSSLISSQQIVNLPGNRATNVSIVWATTGMIGGDYQLEATVVPVNGELNTADNTRTSMILLRQGLPDIAVLRISAPALMLTNGASNVVVMITNQGDLNVTGTGRVYDDTDNRLLTTIPIVNLAPGGIVNWNFIWRTTNALYGYHTLRAALPPAANEVDVADNTNILVVPIGLGWVTNTYVARGSTWFFHDKGWDLGATPWKETNFYDQAWSSSPAPLGYSTPPTQNTNMNYVMSYGPSGNRYPTYYLRTAFFADSLPTNLVLNVRRDDGVILYLNGAELARQNMPAGAVAYTNFASANMTGTQQYTYYSSHASPTNMVLGRNVLAVELHQSSPESADVVLDVEMIGIMPNFPLVHDLDVVSVAPGGDVVSGDRMPVMVTVVNHGSVTETATVVLRDTASGQVLGTKTVSGVGPGGSAAVQIDWPTVGASPGVYNLQAFTVIGNATNLTGAMTVAATNTSSGFGLNAVTAAGAIGGNCAAVATSGNLLVVGAGATLEVWNRAVPSNPVKLGAVRLPGLIEGLAVSGSWVYAACGNAGVQFVDLSVPARPAHRQTFSSSGHAYGVAVNGNFLYVADGVSGVRIINISNPGTPVLAGAWHTEGPARAVAVSGNTAYVLDQHAGLLALNVSSPSTPTLAGTSAGFDGGQALAVSGSIAYVVDRNNRFYVCSLSNAAPAILGNLLLSGVVGQAVAVNGTTVYVAAGGSGLLVINAASAAAPALSSTLPTPGEAQGLALAGSTLYLANGFAGFQVYNVSAPGSPALQADWPTALRANDVVLRNGYAFVAGGESGLRIYAVTNPAAPVLVDRFTQATNARSIALSGPTAYVGDGQYGLKIVNVANIPASLTAIYSSAALDGIRNVGASGSLVVVSDGHKLQLINAAVPSAPALLGSYNAPAFVYALCVADNKAYLACGNAGLVILSVSTGTPLSVLGTYDTPGLASGVSVSGTTAYVADGINGWIILDVTNPAAVSPIKVNTAQGPVVDVAVAGTLASIASGANQARTLDVSIPLTPVERHTFGPLVRAMRLAAEGVLVMTAEDEAGLAILSSGSDMDGDGLPDAWEQQIVNASQATNGPLTSIWHVLPNDDFDGDGLSNQAEQVAGTSPVDAGSRFAVFVAAPNNNMITLQWNSVAGRTYTVYYSTDLKQGFNILQDNIPATAPLNSFNTTAVSGTFYMIGVR